METKSAATAADAATARRQPAFVLKKIAYTGPSHLIQNGGDDDDDDGAGAAPTTTALDGEDDDEGAKGKTRHGTDGDEVRRN